VATREKKTMLICPLGFKQFDQGVSEKLARLHLGWFEGSCETNKGMRSKIQTTLIEVKLSPK
jgi:hypothetical protein